ncbi:MAG: branched-chain amino acid ABC transporter permease [Rhodobacteraceae bacterium]|nr:branched-chain amino acid ABC transporter permease [Paracoccaceae bacterium]
MREFAVALVICLGGIAALALFLGMGKPVAVIGLFLVSGLAVGSLYALGGIGLVVLYRATGVLNLSAGAIGAASVMSAWQLVEWQLPAPIAWLAGLLLGLVLSLGFGRMVAPHLAWREPVVKAVATLGFALVLLGLVSFLWSDDPRRFSLPTDRSSIPILGLRVTLTRLLVVAVAIGLVVAISQLLLHTRIGLQMRALANNRRISSMIGVPILRVETIAWGVSGVIFGFTGLMFGNLVRLEPNVITFLVIPCIAAAICGRLQSLPLVLLGGLAMGVVESLLTLSDTFKAVRPMAPYVIAILVLLMMNRGRLLTFQGGD